MDKFNEEADYEEYTNQTIHGKDDLVELVIQSDKDVTVQYSSIEDIEDSVKIKVIS